MDIAAENSKRLGKVGEHVEMESRAVVAEEGPECKSAG